MHKILEDNEYTITWLDLSHNRSDADRMKMMDERKYTLEAKELNIQRNFYIEELR